ncbi:MAG: hypothetical protein PHS02_01010 [Candidatus ainarchaeum sp.]|nr:hypothetical protein [Candidatus ainarchaeum sp.]
MALKIHSLEVAATGFEAPSIAKTKGMCLPPYPLLDELAVKNGGRLGVQRNVVWSSNLIAYPAGNRPFTITYEGDSVKNGVIWDSKLPIGLPAFYLERMLKEEEMPLIERANCYIFIELDHLDKTGSGLVYIHPKSLYVGLNLVSKNDTFGVPDPKTGIVLESSGERGIFKGQKRRAFRNPHQSICSLGHGWDDSLSDALDFVYTIERYERITMYANLSPFDMAWVVGIKLEDLEPMVIPEFSPGNFVTRLEAARGNLSHLQPYLNPPLMGRVDAFLQLLSNLKRTNVPGGIVLGDRSPGELANLATEIERDLQLLIGLDPKLRDLSGFLHWFVKPKDQD